MTVTVAFNPRPPVLLPRCTYAGVSDVLLDEGPSRVTETNLLDMVCDSILGYFKSATSFEQTDGPLNICLMNGGGVRQSILPVGGCRIHSCWVGNQYAQSPRPCLYSPSIPPLFSACSVWRNAIIIDV